MQQIIALEKILLGAGTSASGTYWVRQVYIDYYIYDVKNETVYSSKSEIIVLQLSK